MFIFDENRGGKLKLSDKNRFSAKIYKAPGVRNMKNGACGIGTAAKSRAKQAAHKAYAPV